MRTSPVRSDEKGLLVYVNGGKYRPGKVSGYAHAYRMDDGGLKVGDRVVVRSINQSPLAKVTCLEATTEGWEPSLVLHWHRDEAPVQSIARNS